VWEAAGKKSSLSQANQQKVDRKKTHLLSAPVLFFKALTAHSLVAQRFKVIMQEKYIVPVPGSPEGDVQFEVNKRRNSELVTVSLLNGGNYH